VRSGRRVAAALSSKYKERCAAVEQFLHARAVPSATRTRVLRFFQQLQLRTLTPPRSLQLLPRAMQLQIQLQANRRLYHTVTVFRHMVRGPAPHPCACANVRGERASGESILSDSGADALVLALPCAVAESAARLLVLAGDAACLCAATRFNHLKGWQSPGALHHPEWPHRGYAPYALLKHRAPICAPYISNRTL
jgi:hypothetical protein